MTLGPADSIFIHGILPRSGTNFLWDLLLLHPECAPAIDPVREDLFLEHSDHLVAFTEAVRASWDPRWGDFPPELPDRLHAALGQGLVSFLRTDAERRLVSKSPSVLNLDRFFTFFPDACLLLLVRDGRSVAQSCMDTFGWEFERAARSWADAADEIVRFRETHAHRRGQWCLVRYEDLVDDLEAEMLRVLGFVGLDPTAYDFDAARDLPVRGSSVHRGPDPSSVHWNPVPKDATFAPKDRWRSWSPDVMERFAWIAGEQMAALDYGIELPSLREERAVRQRLLDVRWALRRGAGQARTRLGMAKRTLGDRFGVTRRG
jgi:hypothetical protein